MGLPNFITKTINFARRVALDIKDLRTRVGLLPYLTTTNKSSLVEAVNEVNANKAAANSLQMWSFIVLVNVNVRRPLQNIDGTNFTASPDGSLYEVFLSTSGTGTITGSKYVLRRSSGAWSIRTIREYGVNSNHPRLELDADGVPVVYTAHATTYNVYVNIKKYVNASSNNINDVAYLGLDFQSLQQTPTTLAGYGITDAYNNYLDTITTTNGTTAGTVYTFKRIGLSDLTLTLTAASTSFSGVVTTGAQTFAGQKTFTASTTRWLLSDNVANAYGFVQSAAAGFYTGTLSDHNFEIYRNTVRKITVGANDVTFVNNIIIPNGTLSTHGVNLGQLNSKNYLVLRNGLIYNANFGQLYATSEQPGSEFGGSAVYVDAIHFGHNGGSKFKRLIYINHDSPHVLRYATSDPTGSNFSHYMLADRTWVSLNYALLSQVYTQAQALGLFVGKTGVETIQDTKTFTHSPVVPNGTLAGHTVNLGQLNSLLANYATETWVTAQLAGVQSPYKAEDNNIKTVGNGWQTYVGGRFNQALGDKITIKGNNLNYIGFNLVGSGALHAVLGNFNVNNGVLNNIVGNYSSANSNLINLIGNYLYSKQEGQSVYGNYNKITVPSNIPSKKVIHAFASGKSEYERDNAVEIFADNSTSFRGRAYYDSQTRNSDWFNDPFTLADVQYVREKTDGILQDFATSYNVCDNQTLVVGVRENTVTSTTARFEAITNNNCFGLYGIAKGAFGIDENIGEMMYKGQHILTQSVRDAILTAVEKYPYLVVRLDTKALNFVDIVYLDAQQIAQNRGSFVMVIIGSFVMNHHYALCFEFNQQIIF